jgi:hypothetical protein
MVFGGVYGMNMILEDCYMLDLEYFIWKAVDLTNNSNNLKIEGRAFHSASKINEFIYYIGGLKK